MSEDYVVLFQCRRCRKNRPAETIDNNGKCERCARHPNVDENGRHYELHRRDAIRTIISKVGGCGRCGLKKASNVTVKYKMSHRKWMRIARAREVALYDAERINRDYEVLCTRCLKHREREELGRLA